MRILLCQGYTRGAHLGRLNSIVFPLGLAYIASAIKADHEVNCWDSNLADNPMDELLQVLEKVNPQVVGLSLRNVDASTSYTRDWYYSSFVSMLKTIREKAPYCKIVVGGAGFSMFAKEVMQRNPEIDFGIIGEGEQSFAQLLRNLDIPERINNLVFWKNGRIYFTEIRQIENLEALTPPSREFFEMRRYNESGYSMNLITKRGCAFKCIFCSNNFISGNICRLRSPKSVVDEIEQMKNNYDIDNYRFADSTFNYPFDYAGKICNELAKRKLEISWIADFHPAFVNKSFIKEAVRSGCSQLVFSPDGASDNALAFLKKNLRVDHIKKSIALVKEIEGAKACYNFMYDLPKYNSEHLVALCKLIQMMEYSLREKLCGIYTTKVRIYPHSPLYDLAVKEGIITKYTNILNPIYYPSKSFLNLESNAANLISKSIYSFETIKGYLMK